MPTDADLRLDLSEHLAHGVANVRPLLADDTMVAKVMLRQFRANIDERIASPELARLFHQQYVARAPAGIDSLPPAEMRTATFDLLAQLLGEWSVEVPAIPSSDGV